MGATIIMVVRHAEKPDTYNGQQYSGVNSAGTLCGDAGSEDLVTLGWERAGALVTLFAPPWGPKAPLAVPQTLFASDPSKDTSSQRPVETLTAVAAALGTGGTPLAIDQTFSKKHLDEMVTAALACEGVVLISWQHEDIPAIGQAILTQTATTNVPIPAKWDGSRYDLVWVFGRPTGSGPIVSFSIFAQMLLAGDGPAPPIA